MSRSYNYATVNAPKVVPRKESECTSPATLCEMPGYIDTALADVKVYDMSLPNFGMRISEGVYKHDVILANSSAVGLEYISSCLFFEGGVKTRLKSEKDIMFAPEGTQNFKYDPQNEYRHWLPANQPFKIAHFSVSPAYFMNFLPENEAWAEKLKSRIIRSERILGDIPPAICVAQAQALQMILNCPVSGKLGETMIETAIIQIMLLNLHSLFQREQTSPSALTQKDVKTAKAVKDYLDETFLTDHSLSDLTKHFGINTNKLMSVFRKAFGKSIFEHIGDLKMQHAHDLLSKEDRTVTEVSRLIGYKNANHFSAAFKKRFGISPTMAVRS